MWLRLLIAAQVLAVTVLASIAVARYPVWTLVDEGAHFDYIQAIADDGRLPVVTDLVSPQVEAIDENVYPAPPRKDRAKRGLAGHSYEAQQPPLYYLLAVPAFSLSSNYRTKVTLVRAFDVLFLLGAIAVFLALCREVLGRGEDALAGTALALTVFLWPAIVVRGVTISNEGLELLVGMALVYALWRAAASRSPGWLIAAGALVGLGLLTRLTVAYLVPVAIGVAVVGALRGPRRFPWWSLAAAAALPVALLVPWAVFNLDHYNALTPTAAARKQQEAVVNPTGRTLGLSDLKTDASAMLNGILPDEWWVVFLSSAWRVARDVIVPAFLVLPLALGALAPLRPGERARAWWLLAAPLLIGLLAMLVSFVVANWNLFAPRYLHPEVPGFALFGALALVRLVPRPRVVGGIAVVLTLALLALWAHLSTVTPASL
ncbi:MAG TPA: glycosyltransferase family 39 protein [Solirubrobacteraceae bacterium]|jgi:4-amino-4-deoxy-L-arabinose transferase-like glycosyltransferase|nr:glycosyltransferase family 39 protein [Solirubrobacteraceae bacterium]